MKVSREDRELCRAFEVGEGVTKAEGNHEWEGISGRGALVRCLIGVLYRSTRLLPFMDFLEVVVVVYISLWISVSFRKNT